MILREEPVKVMIETTNEVDISNPQDIRRINNSAFTTLAMQSDLAQSPDLPENMLKAA